MAIDFEAKSSRRTTRETRIKVLLIGLLSALVIYNLAVAPFTLNFALDSFTDILSILLSLFALGVSITMYFKASDAVHKSSRATLEFSRDITSTLKKMEAGFNERLHLLQSQKQKHEKPKDLMQDVLPSMKAWEKERRELMEKKQESEQLVESMVARLEFLEEEKNELLKKIRKIESDRDDALRELSLYRSRLKPKPAKLREVRLEDLQALERYIRNQVISELGGAEDVSTLPLSSIKRRFDAVISKFGKAFLQDCVVSGIVSDENDLTLKGAQLMQKNASIMVQPEKDHVEENRRVEEV